LDDKQKTNEEVKASSSFDSEKSSENQAFENTEEPAEGFQNVQHDNGSNPAQKQDSEAKEASKDQTNMNNNELSKKLEQLETERLPSSSTHLLILFEPSYILHYEPVHHYSQHDKCENHQLESCKL